MAKVLAPLQVSSGSAFLAAAATERGEKTPTPVAATKRDGGFHCAEVRPAGLVEHHHAVDHG